MIHYLMILAAVAASTTSFARDSHTHAVGTDAVLECKIWDKKAGYGWGGFEADLKSNGDKSYAILDVNFSMMVTKIDGTDKKISEKGNVIFIESIKNPKNQIKVDTDKLVMTKVTDGVTTDYTLSNCKTRQL